MERIGGAPFRVYSISRSASAGVGKKDGKSTKTGRP
jgi:hypothetical protein